MNKRKISYYLGITGLCFFVLMAIFATWLAPYDPNEMGQAFLRPSFMHWLGTNDAGEDILSELIYGSRISLAVGLVSAFIIMCIGTSLGTIAGYYGGKIDSVIMGICNIAIVLPTLPLILLLIAFLDVGLKNLIFVICLTAWASFARIIRAQVLKIREMPYIKMERILGLNDMKILCFHILPNIKELVIMKGCLAIISAMMTEAGLSFLGIGVMDYPSWGNILHYAFFRDGILNNYWWWYLPPILCIFLCTMSFMLICDFYQQEEN